MLPYDVWKQLFPGRSNADLLCTVDKGVILEVYIKALIVHWKYSDNPN